MMERWRELRLKWIWEYGRWGQKRAKRGEGGRVHSFAIHAAECGNLNSRTPGCYSIHDARGTGVYGQSARTAPITVLNFGLYIYSVSGLKREDETPIAI